MFFKMTYIIKPLQLGGEQKFQFISNTRDGKIHYELERIPSEELKKSYSDGDFRCIATTQRDVSEKKQQLFESMERNVPEAIKQLIEDVSTDLSDGIHRIISSIRWKLGLSSLHRFVRFGDALRWSNDETDWKIVPNQISLGGSFDFPVPRSDKLIELEELRELLLGTATPPLAHELFSEAWAQRLINPRSSLIIGMSSVETAFKECASNLMPDAKWLMKNLQSPPLIKMLREFLPTFPAKLLVKGRVLSPPEEVLRILQKGTTIRNEMVHGVDTSIRQDTLDEVLRAIRDVLYLLDYYSGFAWAQDKISGETVQHLIRDSDKPL